MDVGVLSGCCVKGLKQQILALDFLLLHQIVHKGRFSYICVANKRNNWDITVPSF